MALRQQNTAGNSQPLERRQNPRPAGRRIPTVPVVGGDDGLLDAVSLQLPNLGYASLEEGDEAAAIQLFIDGNKIDLLLTEAAVPGMACAELIDAVRALKPDLPFIVMSNRLEAARAT